MIGRGGAVGATGSTATEDPEGRISVGSRLPTAAVDGSYSPAPIGGLIAEMGGSTPNVAADDPAEDPTGGADAPACESASDPEADSATGSASDPALASAWSPPRRHM